MNVIIINESSKKALLKSRRVLSRFLPQIGSGTWAGQISEEGLSDLRDKLREQCVSKLTSICCHRILSRTRTTVAWTFGAKECFDEAGRYSFRDSAARKVATPPRIKASPERFATALLRLAALFHDTGKSSIAFQAKLQRGRGAEAVRHDLLSFLVHAESLWTAGVTDTLWLQSLADDPSSACSSVQAGQLLPVSSRWLTRLQTGLSSEKSILVGKTELTQLNNDAPGLLTVLWLVLTHHRLPAGDASGEQLDPHKHMNFQSEALDAMKIAPLSDCLTVAPGMTPWQTPAWLTAVSSAAKQALAALQEMSASASPLPPHFWIQLAAHQLRPALVLSDHLGSKQAMVGPKKRDVAKAPQVFANTQDDKTFGDTLAVHELKVSRLTRAVQNLAFADMQKTSLPENSIALKKPGPGPFEWQSDLESSCVAAKNNGAVFLSIVAETGAGKTLAAVRAAHALSGGHFRLTFALGLRSLTWQSAQAMLEDARIPAADVVVAVGHPETLGLSDKAQALMAELKGGPAGAVAAAGVRFGSESSEGADVCAEIKTKDRTHPWVDALCSQKEAAELWGPKALSLLSAPVLACTADHLVASVSLLKGGDAKLYLRQATSDLILDEIDSYTAEDLQSIAKLAFAAGSYGRNVILMSATMSPGVQAGLYEAWQRGLELHCALHEKPLSFASVFSSNTVKTKVLVSPSSSVARKAWEEYVTQVARAYALSAAAGQRRRLRVVELAAKDRAGAMEELAGHAMNLHVANSTVDAKTGARVSVGFIRFNSAKSAWKMARFLASRAPAAGEPLIKFVSYHAKYPRSYLGVLDATLGQMTSRKSAEGFLDTPALRDAIDGANGRDVLVLVCTTTLMETGRDFDFDWCILEPRSVRGEVQAIGRVLRHRRNSIAAEPNVVLLGRPLKFLDTPDGLMWSHPGVEDSLAKLRVSTALPSPFAAPGSTVSGLGASMLTPGARSRPVPRGSGMGTGYVTTAAEALPLAQWHSAFDAQLCLLPATDYAANRIGYLEQAVQALHLTGASSWNSASGLPPSLGYYLGSTAPLNSVHASLTLFRGTPESTLLFLPSSSRVSYWDEESNKPLSCLSAKVGAVPAGNALIPQLGDLAAALERKNSSLHVRGCSLRCKASEGATKQLEWDPLLGFLEGAA